MQIRTLGPETRQWGTPRFGRHDKNLFLGVSWLLNFIVCRSITYWMERSATLSDIVSYGQLQLAYYIC